MTQYNPTIKFLHNWNNKLDNDIFTTIRLFHEDKYMFYKYNRYNVFNVELNNKLYCKAQLFNISIHDRLIDVPFDILCTDTGMDFIDSITNLFKNFNVNKDDSVVLLTFSKK